MSFEKYLWAWKGEQSPCQRCFLKNLRVKTYQNAICTPQGFTRARQCHSPAVSCSRSRSQPKAVGAELDLQFQFPTALDHAKSERTQGERGTRPSSPLPASQATWAGSSSVGPRTGSGKLAGTKGLEKDRFSRAVKGNGAWKGKLGLPGGRDKAKLKSKSLEASWEKTWKQTGNGRKMGMGVKNIWKLSHLLAASVWNAPRTYRILLQRWTTCRRAKLFLSSFRISFHIADGLHRYQYNNAGLNCCFF